MSFEPIRFVHAANLRLDVQLSGIDECPDELREPIENATITALDRMIAAAIERRADFVLLTGNSFDEHEQSLPARLALLEGFRRLAEHDIRVFVLPGETDPSEAWRAIPQLPDNVTPFYDRQGGAVAVIRDGKVIATVACVDAAQESEIHSWPSEESRSLRTNETSETGAKDVERENDPPETRDQKSSAPSSRREPFRIGLCIPPDQRDPQYPRPSRQPEEDSSALDENANVEPPHTFHISLRPETTSLHYLAMGGPTARRTLTSGSRLVHHPGPAQPLCGNETGSHGCTLVEVEVDGTARCRFLPTASVRREKLSVAIDAAQSRDDLLETMQRLLEQRSPSAGELVWLVDWTLYGCLPDEASGEEGPWTTGSDGAWVLKTGRATDSSTSSREADGPADRIDERPSEAAGGSTELRGESAGESERQFLDSVERRLRRDDVPRILHSLKVLPRRTARESPVAVRGPFECDALEVVGADLNTDPASVFFAALEAEDPQARSDLVDDLRELPSASDDWADRLARLLDDVDEETILGRARAYGIGRFGPGEVDRGGPQSPRNNPRSVPAGRGLEGD